MSTEQSCKVQRSEVRSADGTMIPVFESGFGRPVVFVHGGVGSHATWDALLPFVQAHFTVLAIDRRNGLVDPKIRYELQREFEDVAAVANAQDGEVDVIGQSSGAVCALGASLLIPRLRKLVLYEPPLLGMTESNIENMERLVQAGDLEAAAESFMRDSMKVSPETIAVRKAAADWAQSAASAPYQIREEAVLRAWEPEPRDFAALNAATLILVGSLTPPGHHHRGYIGLLKDVIPNFGVQEIPGEEHGAFRRAPELFARILLEFLEMD